MAKRSQLNAKQAAFVREYLKDFNAKQACIRAGYSAKTAEVNGPRLLRNARVQAAIEAGTAKLAAKAELTVADILERYTRIAETNVTDVVDFRRATKGKGHGIVVKSLADIPEAARYAISEIAETPHGIKVKFHSKTEALARLGQYLQMWVERVEHGGKVDLDVNAKSTLESKLDALGKRLRGAA